MDTTPKSILMDSTKTFLDLKSLVTTIDDLLEKQVTIEGVDTPLNMIIRGKKMSLIDAMSSSMRYFDLRVIYPNTIWSSLFLTGYSLLEHTLDELSDCLAEQKQTILLPRDLRHKGIERSVVFLTKLAMIEIPIGGLQWKSIQEANEYRNCIAHANGKISNSNNVVKIEAILKESKSVYQKDDYLILSKEYVLEFFDNCSTFLLTIQMENYS